MTPHVEVARGGATVLRLRDGLAKQLVVRNVGTRIVSGRSNKVVRYAIISISKLLIVFLNNFLRTEWRKDTTNFLPTQMVLKFNLSQCQTFPELSNDVRM